MALTGRYRIQDVSGTVVFEVEDHAGGFVWRLPVPGDLQALEPMIADGWRFPSERDGVLGMDGKRYREVGK